MCIYLKNLTYPLECLQVPPFENRCCRTLVLAGNVLAGSNSYTLTLEPQLQQTVSSGSPSSCTEAVGRTEPFALCTGVGASGSGHSQRPWLSRYPTQQWWSQAEPEHSLPSLFETIKLFSKWSGYKVNWANQRPSPWHSTVLRLEFNLVSLLCHSQVGFLFPSLLNILIQVHFEPLGGLHYSFPSGVRSM